MDNNINVEIGDLRTAISTISSELETIDGIIKDAKAAGDAAINALGGEGTPAGGAVKSKMITINDEEFEKTSKSINNFFESLGNVQKTYTEAENEFVDMINKFDANKG